MPRTDGRLLQRGQAACCKQVPIANAVGKTRPSRAAGVGGLLVWGRTAVCVVVRGIYWKTDTTIEQLSDGETYRFMLEGTGMEDLRRVFKKDLNQKCGMKNFSIRE